MPLRKASKTKQRKDSKSWRFKFKCGVEAREKVITDGLNRFQQHLLQKEKILNAREIMYEVFQFVQDLRLANFPLWLVRPLSTTTQVNDIHIYIWRIQKPWYCVKQNNVPETMFLLAATARNDWICLKDFSEVKRLLDVLTVNEKLQFQTSLEIIQSSIIIDYCGYAYMMRVHLMYCEAGQAIDILVFNFQVKHRWRNKELQLMITLFQHSLLIQHHSDPPSLLLHEGSPGNMEELFTSCWADMRLAIHNSDASLTRNFELDFFLGRRHEFQIHIMDFYRALEHDSKFPKLLEQLKRLMGSVLEKMVVSWISVVCVFGLWGRRLYAQFCMPALIKFHRRACLQLQEKLAFDSTHFIRWYSARVDKSVYFSVWHCWKNRAETSQSVSGFLWLGLMTEVCFITYGNELKHTLKIFLWLTKPKFLKAWHFDYKTKTSEKETEVTMQHTLARKCGHIGDFLQDYILEFNEKSEFMMHNITVISAKLPVTFQGRELAADSGIKAMLEQVIQCDNVWEAYTTMTDKLQFNLQQGMNLHEASWHCSTNEMNQLHSPIGLVDALHSGFGEKLHILPAAEMGELHAAPECVIDNLTAEQVFDRLFLQQHKSSSIWHRWRRKDWHTRIYVCS